MIIKLLLWAHLMALAAGVGGGLGMSQVGPRLVNAAPDQRETWWPLARFFLTGGVTLAMKNMSHGMNNNVARSHVSNIYRPGGGESWPNQCNIFIPSAVNQPLLREKAALHIMDGLIAVYEGGPGSWNASWGTWRRQSLFFATDPVAMDMVGWAIIDAKRILEGWLPLAEMGRVQHRPLVSFSPRLAAQVVGQPQSAPLAVAQHQAIPDGRGSEFDIRQPEHVIHAGLLGLGKYDARDIEHRVLE